MVENNSVSSHINEGNRADIGLSSLASSENKADSLIVWTEYLKNLTGIATHLRERLNESFAARDPRALPLSEGSQAACNAIYITIKMKLLQITS